MKSWNRKPTYWYWNNTGFKRLCCCGTNHKNYVALDMQSTEKYGIVNNVGRGLVNKKMLIFGPKEIDDINQSGNLWHLLE